MPCIQMNLILSAGEKVAFHVKGDKSVYLSGILYMAQHSETIIPFKQEEQMSYSSDSKDNADVTETVSKTKMCKKIK